MLKHLVAAAGLLLAAQLSCGTSASAAPRHMLRAHHGATVLNSRHGRTGFARLAWHRGSSRRIASRAPRLRVAHFHAARRRFAAANLGRGRSGRRIALRVGRRHLAALSRDAAIRNAVGPRAAYVPVSTPTVGTQIGGASFYSGGGRTASGGVVGAATCAHRSLPFGTKVLVTNLVNGAKTVLTVNDRGPFARGRILDVSRSAAGVLGMLHTGTARIAMQVLGGPGGQL